MSTQCDNCMEMFSKIEDEIKSVECGQKVSAVLAEACAMFSEKVTAFKQVCSLHFKEACPAMKALVIKQSTAKKVCTILRAC